MTRHSNNDIKVGFCVAYDWPLLAYAVPQIYESADVIFCSVDKDRISWAHKSFLWDATGFAELLKRIDPLGKIRLYEDNFHLTELSPAENEKRQRTLMAQQMGEGGWHIQLDCDEYFLNFAGFVQYLKRLPARPYNYNVCCQLITVFKRLDHGHLCVWPNARSMEFLQIASRSPVYEHGRRNGFFNILTAFLIVHQSWARSESEIAQKLANWGHAHDFNVEEYFEFWRSVTEHNCEHVKDFHPIQGRIWPALRFIRSDSPAELISGFEQHGFPTLTRARRMFRNSLLASRLVHVATAFCRKLRGVTF